MKLNARELRKLSVSELENKVDELRSALVVEEKSTKRRSLKKAIARCLTLISEAKEGKALNTGSEENTVKRGEGSP